MDNNSTDKAYNQSDMKAWFIQKQTNVVSGLSYLMLNIQQSELDNILKQNLLEEIELILYDATKVLSYACNSDWTREDHNLIMKYQSNGVDELLRRYGQKRDSNLSSKARIVNDFIDTFFKYLEDGRGNRTFIYDKVHSLILYKIPVINEIFDELEKLTMNIISWEDFVLYCKCREERILELRDLYGTLV